MTDRVEAWERPATIFLVDTATDKKIFLPLLQKLAEEHESIAEIRGNKSIKDNLDIAYKCLDDEEGRKFLVMFTWDHINQTYLPFSSGLFEDSEVDVIHNVIKLFIENALRSCCNGFEFRNINEGNKLIGFCIQALCENEMMRREIEILKGRH